MNFREYLIWFQKNKAAEKDAKGEPKFKPITKAAFRKNQRKYNREHLAQIRASMQEMAGCRHVVAPVPAWPSPVEQSPKTSRDSKRPGWARKRDRRRKERL